MSKIMGLRTKDFSDTVQLKDLVIKAYNLVPRSREIFSLDMFDLTNGVEYREPGDGGERGYILKNGNYDLFLIDSSHPDGIRRLTFRYNNQTAFTVWQNFNTPFIQDNVINEILAKKAVGKDLEGVLEL